MNENFETKLKAAVKEAIYDCDRADVVEAWNEICSDSYHIYPMADFDEVCDTFVNMSASEIIREVNDNFDNFDDGEDYFYMDYGSYKSTDDPFDIIDMDELAQNVIDGEVEIDGLDLDEIKEEVKKECGSYRAFKTIDEFKETILVKIGETIEFRSKEDNDRVVTAMLIEVGIDYAHAPFVALGRSSFNFSTLFNGYEYKKDGEWVPFGVLDVTDTEKTENSEDNSNEN